MLAIDKRFMEGINGLKKGSKGIGGTIQGWLLRCSGHTGRRKNPLPVVVGCGDDFPGPA